MTKLLTTDPRVNKIAGSRDKGWVTGIQFLEPNVLSGLVNMCPHATEGCKAVCIEHTGKMSYPVGKRARKWRTQLWVQDKHTYWTTLIHEIHLLKKRARWAKGDFKPAVRLNGTSDVMWERHLILGQKSIMGLFEEVQFYDYTKWPYEKRPNGLIPSNYHLTYSRSEKSTDHEIALNLVNGRNVAVVFHPYIPEEWEGIRVVSGDDGDARMDDPTPVVIGLKAKGSAKTDKSGFTVQLGKRKRGQ